MEKTNKIILIIIACLLVLILAVLLFKKTPAIQNQTPPAGKPVEQQPVLKKDSVNSITLGKVFTAHKNQVFTIKNSYGDTFTITDFINITCSSGSKCLLPTTKQVVYKIQTATKQPEKIGRVYDSLKESDLLNMPYYIIVKNSDYKTYADIVIEIQGRGASN